MRSRTPTTAVLLSLLVATAGCTGDDGDSADDTTTTAAPTTVAPATTATAGSFDGTFTYGYVQPPAGPLDELALAQGLGISMALADLNAAGGVDGAEAVLLTATESAASDPTAAIDELGDQGATVLIGPVSSTSAIAARPALVRRGALACTGSATAPNVTGPSPEEPDVTVPIVRTALPDEHLAAAVADELVARRTAAGNPEGWNVVTVARDDDYGRSMSGGLTAALVARGVEATTVTYNPFTVLFGPQVQDTASLSPDVVVMVSYEETARLLDQLVQGGIAPTSIVGLDGAVTPSLPTAASASDPAAMDGVTVYGTTGDLAFLTRALAEPGAREVAYVAQVYDCVVATALAADSTDSTDPATILGALPAVTADGVPCTTYADCVAKLAAGEDIDYDGPSGRIALDADGDPGSARITTIVVTDGEMRVANTKDIDLRQQARDEAIYASASFTTRLQQALTLLGFYTGPIDGIWDDEVTAALVAFQTANGLEPTGEFDAATDAAMRAQLGDAAALLSTSIADLQIALTDLGFYTGPIDGVYSAETIAAVKALQASLGVPQTGVIDVATLQAIYVQGVVTGTTTTTAAPTTVAPTAPPTEPPTVPPTAPPTAPPTEAPETAPPTEAPETAPPTTDAPPAPTARIMDVLRAEPSFSDFVTVIDTAGIPSGLDPLKAYTVFAPTNDALAGADLPTDPAELQESLAVFVVEGVFTSADLVNGLVLFNVYGNELTVSVAADGTITIGGAVVVAPFDLIAANGVVHGIDRVIEPRAA